MKVLASTQLPTAAGTFQFIAFGEEGDAHPHVALYSPQEGGVTDVRVHSECMTGDVFGSLKCDCGGQLHAALDRFGATGGLLIYLRQEGRGIGLVEKIKAYELQAQGFDTLDANLELGHEGDEREYGAAIWLLQELNVRALRLHSNNPEKLKSLQAAGFEVIDRVSIEIQAAPENAGYLRTKRDRMGHWFDQFLS